MTNDKWKMENGKRNLFTISAWPPELSIAISGRPSLNLIQRARGLFDGQRADELRRMNRLDGLPPRVDVSVRRRLDLGVQPLTNSLAVVDQNGAQLFNPQAFSEIVSAFQILRVLAVILHEASYVE